MDIEKTLAELGEKVNALASLQIETEMRLARLAESQRITDDHLQRFIQRIDNAMGQVANILAGHENRIDRLEGDQTL